MMKEDRVLKTEGDNNDSEEDDSDEETRGPIKLANSIKSKHDNYKNIERYSDIYPNTVNNSASLSMLKKCVNQNIIPK